MGPNTRFHLFLYQRMASLYLIMNQLDQVEEMFKISISVAENSKERLNKSMD